MAKAQIINKAGGEFEWGDIPLIRPNADEVLLSHTLIGLNDVDLLYKNGIYKTEYPAIIGVEAVGIIEDIGENVRGFNVGDRVAYANAILGSYSEFRTISAKYLLKLPDEITDEIAAASLYKGLVAHSLLMRAYTPIPKVNMLVYDAAGSVGSILCQWAKIFNLRVIAVVESPKAAAIALSNGCADVIISKGYATDISSQVKDLTAGLGVNVVYDFIGRTTFNESIKSLMIRGIMVACGAKSGEIEQFSPAILRKKSLFFTNFKFEHYKSDQADYLVGASELFVNICQKNITINIDKAYDLINIKQAYHDLESGNIVGSGIIIV